MLRQKFAHKVKYKQKHSCMQVTCHKRITNKVYTNIFAKEFAIMTQQVYVNVPATATTHEHLKPHTIWQDGRTPEPCTIIIFGATGDLAQRKIYPTLAHLLEAHPTPECVCIIASARRPFN